MTSDTAFTSSGNSVTLDGTGSGGGGFGNVTWEPSFNGLSFTRDAFALWGAPDDDTANMQASIGYSSSVNKWILNNPGTGGMSIESRGDVTFKKQDREALDLIFAASTLKRPLSMAIHLLARKKGGPMELVQIN